MCVCVCVCACVCVCVCVCVDWANHLQETVADAKTSVLVRGATLNDLSDVPVLVHKTQNQTQTLILNVLECIVRVKALASSLTGQ